MKKMLTVAVACSAFAAMASADPIEGTWQTQPDAGAYAHVDIAPCGPNFCGKIAKTFNETGAYQSPNLGKTLVIDMANEGGGKYEGKVWRPSNDKVYLGKIALKGDRMELSGCVAGGLFCSKQTWARVR